MSPPPPIIINAPNTKSILEPLKIETRQGMIPNRIVGIKTLNKYSDFFKGSLHVQYGVKYWTIKPKEIDLRCSFANKAKVIPCISSCTIINIRYTIINKRYC